VGVDGFLTRALAVGAGGFLGSLLRWLLAGAIDTGGGRLPLGTLGVNVLGCLLIGALGGLWLDDPAVTPELRLLLVTGVLGGFTTFSSFGWETLQMVREGSTGAALLYVTAQVVLGVGAAAVGFALAVQTIR
jgi:CrcB protein